MDLSEELQLLGMHALGIRFFSYQTPLLWVEALKKRECDVVHGSPEYEGCVDRPIDSNKRSCDQARIEGES